MSQQRLNKQNTLKKAISELTTDLSLPDTLEKDDLELSGTSLELLVLLFEAPMDDLELDCLLRWNIYREK